MNKYIILIFTVLIVFSENTYTQSTNDTLGKEFAIKMMDAILYQKTDVIKACQPNVAIARKLTGDKTSEFLNHRRIRCLFT